MKVKINEKWFDGKYDNERKFILTFEKKIL